MFGQLGPKLTICRPNSANLLDTGQLWSTSAKLNQMLATLGHCWPMFTKCCPTSAPRMLKSAWWHLAKRSVQIRLKLAELFVRIGQVGPNCAKLSAPGAIARSTVVRQLQSSPMPDDDDFQRWNTVGWALRDSVPTMRSGEPQGTSLADRSAAATALLANLASKGSLARLAAGRRRPTSARMVAARRGCRCGAQGPRAAGVERARPCGPNLAGCKSSCPGGWCPRPRELLAAHGPAPVLGAWQVRSRAPLACLPGLASSELQKDLGVPDGYLIGLV